MKKIIAITIFVVICQMTYSQINANFEGTWLPEKYVDNLVKNTSTDSIVFLFPIEGIIISIEEVTNFIDYYSIEINPDSVILIQPYKSETNTLQYKSLEGEKFLLIDFYRRLNLKYVAKSNIEFYREAELILSMKDDKLLLEIINVSSIELIYFVNGIEDYKFNNINSAKEYLQQYNK